eukprot:4168238-Pleurochrysis_carterae.AAC.5
MQYCSCVERATSCLVNARICESTQRTDARIVADPSHDTPPPFLVSPQQECRFQYQFLSAYDVTRRSQSVAIVHQWYVTAQLATFRSVDRSDAVSKLSRVDHIGRSDSPDGQENHRESVVTPEAAPSEIGAPTIDVVSIQTIIRY